VDGKRESAKREKRVKRVQISRPSIDLRHPLWDRYRLQAVALTEGASAPPPQPARLSDLPHGDKLLKRSIANFRHAKR
jgi:hypothetical protein